MEEQQYDVIVVGAGHAGIEAALAAARMGRRTLLLTMNLDSIGLMPCNPSIGGPAKGHLVREIDALGGEMGRAVDDTFIHIRTLNTGKGPAVQALRAQADKALYRLRMKRALERQPGLDVKQAMVDGLLVEPVGSTEYGGLRTEGDESGSALSPQHSVLSTQTHRVAGVVTSLGRRYLGRTVVLTTGTSLRGRVIVGDVAYTSGRSGEAAAMVLSGGLKELGFETGRLKTGTPPRIDARTIDFSLTELLPGSPVPLHFSFWSGPEVDAQPFPEPDPVYPLAEPAPWRPQMPCYLVHTSAATHEVIRANLDRAPLFTGVIEGTGPRYCPSIEDKIVRFAHKEQHQFFLEPEGWETTEVYVQGANTSLPEDVQEEMLRTIPALRNAELMRVGYAIEYDYVPPRQITAWLETKLVAGLFLAGQINGTSGYEEAAGQGLLAGVNAALASRGDSPLMLERWEAYLGVMVDDLVTREIVEPYRLLTSRAEHRLLLRQDNADERLTPLGYQLGLIDEERFRRTERKYELVRAEEARLARTWLVPSAEFNGRLEAAGQEPLSTQMSAASLLCRPEMSYELLAELLNGDGETGGQGDGEKDAETRGRGDTGIGDVGRGPVPRRPGTEPPRHQVTKDPGGFPLPLGEGQGEGEVVAGLRAGHGRPETPAPTRDEGRIPSPLMGEGRGEGDVRAAGDEPPPYEMQQGDGSTHHSSLITHYSPVAEQVEIRIRYEPYIQKQAAHAERMRKLEHLPIPDALDYGSVAGLRNEAREKLARFRPATVGMASRVAGVTPADVAVLLVALEKLRRGSRRPDHEGTNGTRTHEEDVGTG